jgi:hypothetical protein
MKCQERVWETKPEAELGIEVMQRLLQPRSTDDGKFFVSSLRAFPIRQSESHKTFLMVYGSRMRRGGGR